MATTTYYEIHLGDGRVIGPFHDRDYAEYVANGHRPYHPNVTVVEVGPTGASPVAADYLAELHNVAVGAFAPGNDAAADEELAGALSACMDGLTGCGIAYDAAYNMTEDTLELAYLAAKANAKETEDEAMLTTTSADLLTAVEAAQYAATMAWMADRAAGDAAEAALNDAYAAAMAYPGHLPQDVWSAQQDGRNRAHADFRARVARRNAAQAEAIPAAVPAPLPGRRSLVGRVALGIAGALTLALGLGSVALATIPAAPADNFGIPYTAAQANAMAWAERGSFGPILHAGPDAAVLIDGELTQLEYIPCRYEAGALWHEDGSASRCEAVAAWQEARTAHIAGLVR